MMKMPEPVGEAFYDHVHKNGLIERRKTHIYTADQMRAFAQEATRQAMERAVQACLDQAAKTSVTATDTRDPAFTMIDHAAITRCVAAIRALSDVAGEKGVGK